MNDPFAMLNPIDKPKTAPAYGGPPAAPVAPLHPVGGVGFGGVGAPAPGMGMGMGMGALGGMGPGGMGMGGMPGGMGMGGGMLGGMSMGGGMPGGMGLGGGMPGMGPGMPGGMAPGMGGMPQQAPIMYDNIKNLLEQKAKPSGAMRDDAGMDFLENLGSGKTNSLSVTSPTSTVAAPSPFAPAVDPFGGPAAAPAHIAAPTVSLPGFELPGESSSSAPVPTTVSPSGGGPKSSALAERLANGRRKTQETQREQLGFSAGAFTQSSGAPKISLKELAPSQPTKSSEPSSDRNSRAPSLEDFASGKPVFQESDPFGMSSGGSSSRTNSSSGSHHSQPKQASFSSPPYAATGSAFGGGDSGVILADSDADFEMKLNGGSSTGSGSSRHLSSGNLGGGAARTGSGGAAAKATMDFGW